MLRACRTRLSGENRDISIRCFHVPGISSREGESVVRFFPVFQRIFRREFLRDFCAAFA